jgi:hypothetical protein
MPAKKRCPDSSRRRRIARLEQQLKSVEAQIVRLEKDASLDLAVQDHFVLWRRPSLFAALPSGIQH